MNNTRNNKNNRKVNNISRKNNGNGNYYNLIMKNYSENQLENFQNGYISETQNPSINIIVNDYIFKLVIDEDYVNYMFRFISNSGAEPCIVIFIDKENQTEATLEKVYYSEGCSYSETPLEQKNGTIIMLQTALKVASDIFKNIKYFKLKDMSHKYNKNIMESIWITPRRLLEQKPGWYEEYFGATPTNDTKKVKALIKKFYSKIEEDIPKNNLSWWTTANILKLTSIIDRNFLTKNILGTYWNINRKTISDYNITYDIPNRSNIPVLYNNTNNTEMNIINNNYQLNKFFNRNNTNNK
jgi:hypothetical protein